MKENLGNNTFSLLKNNFHQFEESQIQFLSEIMIALSSNISKFTLSEISFYLPGEDEEYEKYQKLLNFLDSFIIDSSYWKSVISLIFSFSTLSFESEKYVTILLNESALKNDIWVLSASFSYQGRSLPIYIKTWRDPTKKFNFWYRVDVFLRELKLLLPNNINYIILGDIYFQGYEMYRTLTEFKFKYIIRIGDYYFIKTKSEKQYKSLTLYNEEYLVDVSLGKFIGFRTNIGISNLKEEEGNNNKLHVMTNLNQEEEPIEILKSRLWRELNFKNLKYILMWEKYDKNFLKKQRLEKCIIINCLSYAIQVLEGND